MADAPPPSYEQATGQNASSHSTGQDTPSQSTGAPAHGSIAGLGKNGVSNPTVQASDAFEAPEVIVQQPQGSTVPPGDRMRASWHGEVPQVDEVVADEGCCGTDKDGQTCCCGCRVLFSTLAHLGFLVGIIGIILSFVLDSVSEQRTDFIITAGVCYGVLWLETWCSHDLSFLCGIKSLEEFKEYMSDMHQQTPEISMKVECYHYETRYRTVYYTDAQGNSQSRTESYTERVTTHREKETFEYSRCRETSPPNINLDGSRATRVTFYMMWHFADAATKAAYDNQYQALQDRNRYRDTYMDSYENCELPGFKKRMLAYMNPADNHPCFHPCVYICLSWFVLTWPYRWWFKSKTGHTNYTFDKEIGL